MVLITERRQATVKQAEPRVMAGEVMAFCPVCKAFQTLWFTEGKLVPTRKFVQYDDKVYHDCGANEPCRLYPIF